MQPFPQSPEPPWIVAHRGASADFPENSLVAFQAAAAVPGVDAIEMDVQLSRDGVPVVFHDETLERMGHGPDRIADCDWAGLRRVGIGTWFDPRFHRETLPSLAEALAALPEQTLCLELKVYPSTPWDDLARRMVHDVLELGAEERVMILSFDHRALEVVRNVCPGMRTVGLFRGVPPDLSVVDPLYAVDISLRRATPEFVRAAQQRGRPVIVYTCNTQEEVDRARALGVNAITTDRPAWLAAQV